MYGEADLAVAAEAAAAAEEAWRRGRREEAWPLDRAEAAVAEDFIPALR
jgi:hypothetical protein